MMPQDIYLQIQKMQKSKIMFFSYKNFDSLILLFKSMSYGNSSYWKIYLQEHERKKKQALRTAQQQNIYSTKYEYTKNYQNYQPASKTNQLAPTKKPLQTKQTERQSNHYYNHFQNRNQQIQDFRCTSLIPKTIYNQIKVLQVKANTSKLSILRQQAAILFKQGLPNLGNTCHLNSVLQFLYSAQQFRAQIMSKKTQLELENYQQQKNVFLILVAKIFSLLKEYQFEYHKKKQLLHSLISWLQYEHQTYKQRAQEDALKTLNLLLRDIDQSYHKESLIKKFFKIEIQMQCKCMVQPLIIEQLYYSSQSAQICSSCHSLIDKKIVSHPKYLIVVGSVEKKWLKIQNQQYQFISKIVYNGTGRVGHYSCVRMEGNIKVEFSDLSATIVEEESPKFQDYFQLRKYNQTRALLYKKKPLTSFNSQRFSRTSNKAFEERSPEQESYSYSSHFKRTTQKRKR